MFIHSAGLCRRHTSQRERTKEEVMYTLEDIRQADPQIADIICEEYERQSSHIELIASENWVSRAGMAAMGSILTN